MTEQNNSTRLTKKQEGPVTVAIRAVREPEDSTAPAKPERPPQTIRGGFLIVSRNGGSGRLKKIADRPFEHASLAEAEAQAAVLAARHGGEFSVFMQMATVMPPAIVAAPVTSPPAETISKPAERRPLLVERRTRRVPSQGVRA
jgi:hypothetical protein